MGNGGRSRRGPGAVSGKRHSELGPQLLDHAVVVKPIILVCLCLTALGCATDVEYRKFAVQGMDFPKACDLRLDGSSSVVCAPRLHGGDPPDRFGTETAPSEMVGFFFPLEFSSTHTLVRR